MAGFSCFSLHNNKTLPPPQTFQRHAVTQHGEVGSSGYIENNFDKTELVSWKPPLKFT